MRRLTLPAALLFLALLTAGMIPALAAPPETAPDGDRLTITTRQGPVQFHVEVADTPAFRRRGLQGRKTLAGDRGMLFLFEYPQDVHMWMKSTLIPLDMLFIDAEGRIARIEAETTPFSLTPIAAGSPVTGVLEVPGGSTERLGIQAGDRVTHPAFGNSQPPGTAER